MTQKPEAATDQAFTHSNYKPARIVDGTVSISTADLPPPIRTAVTATTAGTITLRYAPREQPPLTGKTSR